MIMLSRRGFISASAAMCVSPAAINAADSIQLREELEAQANSALHFLIQNFPSTQDLVTNSAGFLIVPVITQGALLLGAAVGDGVLRTNGKTTGYYTAMQVNIGLQISARQYSQAVFFLNEAALKRFADSRKWRFGAGMRYVVLKDTQGSSYDSLTRHADVAGMSFGNSGLYLGASLEGTRYTPLEG